MAATPLRGNAGIMGPGADATNPAFPSSIYNEVLFRMDTQFLQSFVMVVDSGSIAEAARRLDITPAAVAARVKSLEEAMGTALVRRAGRTVKATEAGLRILTCCATCAISTRWPTTTPPWANGGSACRPPR
jgi:hypothetical protein